MKLIQPVEGKIQLNEKLPTSNNVTT